MSDIVLVGLLSVLGTMIGAFSGILTANKLSNYRIAELEKKVDKHNSVIDRMYRAEKRLDVIDQRLEDKGL